MGIDLGNSGLPDKKSKNLTPAVIPVLADTGCQSCLTGSNILPKLNLSPSDLIPVTTKMRTASDEYIEIIGAVFLELSGTDPRGKRYSTKQMTYVTNSTGHFFLSRGACMDLRIIPDDFPSIGDTSCSSILQPGPAASGLFERPTQAISPSNSTAPCGCPVRTKPPPPPVPPVHLIDANREKLQSFLLEYYKSSTFNICTHQILPLMSGPPMDLKIDSEAKPVARHTPNTVPINLQEATKASLDKDVRLGVIRPVPANTPTKWCHAMAVVPKRDGTVRRTGDFQELNKYALRDTHHTPSPFHLARAVPHNVKKTTCDAWNGYNSVPITERSIPLTTFITPWGRYQCLVAPQGYAASGDAYTRKYDEITAGFQDMVRCIDDTLLWSANTEGCFNRTVSYLELCGENGIILNPEKFNFAADIVEFAGFEITKESVRPCARFLKAITDFPTPKSITDVRSWFGLVNQASYAFSMTNTMLPFRQLLTPKQKFEWTPELEAAFQTSKDVIVNDVKEGVRIYDKARPTCLATDWSKSGIGFWLFQKHCNCSDIVPDCCKTGWKIVLIGSRFTRPAESRYAPVEGEALAVVYSLDKAKHFVLGCSDLIIAVDHKTLLKIFGDRILEDIPNPRLRNLKEKTLCYKFRMIHVSGIKHKVADGLSRYPVSPAEVVDLPDDAAQLNIDSTAAIFSQDPCARAEINIIATAHSVFSSSPITMVSWDLVRTATSSDTDLHTLTEFIENGFPASRVDVPEPLKVFFPIRDKLSTIDGVIFYNERVLIPSSLRHNVLSTLHAAHQGTSSMIARAESSVYWPGISKDITDIRSRCAECNKNAPSNPSAPPTPPILPVYPFQCICADFFYMEENNTLSLSIDTLIGPLSVKHIQVPLVSYHASKTHLQYLEFLKN